jgi:hypothetical protein
LNRQVRKVEVDFCGIRYATTTKNRLTSGAVSASACRDERGFKSLARRGRVAASPVVERQRCAIEVMADFPWFSIEGRIIEDDEFSRPIEPAELIITIAPSLAPTDTAGQSCRA